MGVGVVITQNELEQFALRRCRRKWFMFEQQEFEYYMRPSNALRRYNGCRLIAFLGIYLLVIGLMLHQLTGSTYLRIPYTETDDVIYFRTTDHMKGPFAVYVYLDNFYANARQYIDDAPPYFKKDTMCRQVNTVAEVFSVRDAASFPELKDTTDAFRPCGLQSATFFNDYFTLHAVDCPGNCTRYPALMRRGDGNEFLFVGPDKKPEPLTCCSYRLLPVEFVTKDVALSDWLLLFAKKFDPGAWTDIIGNKRLQSWYFKPFLNNRMVLVAMLSTYYLPQGYYALKFEQNVWPARQWNTGKEVVVATFGALGSDQHALWLICVSWGTMLIVVALLFYWAVRRNIVFLTDTMANIPPLHESK